MAARTGDEAIGGGVSGGQPSENATQLSIDGFAAFLDGDALVVPADFDLLKADFTRLGADLVATAPDGTQLFITDYFALPLQADLATAEGAVLPAATVAVLAGPQAPGQYAQAGANDAAAPQAIGEVKSIEGRVVITRADGSVIEAELGTAIYTQDVVETTFGGAIGILFVDDTSFALGGNARMVMDQFVFDPAAAGNQSVLTVVQGAFSFVSGQVAKSGDDALTIETPTLTIGVRGTAVVGKAAAEGAETRVALVRDPDGSLGKIFVSNNKDGYLIDEENQSVSGLGRNENLTMPEKLSRDQIEALGGSALKHLPDQENDGLVRDDDGFGANDGDTTFGMASGIGSGFADLRASDPYQSRGVPGEGSPDSEGDAPPTGLIIPAESGTNDRVYGGDGRILAEQGTFSTSGPGGLNASSPIVTPASAPNPFLNNDGPPGSVPPSPPLLTDTSTFTDNDDPFGGVSPFPVISGPSSVSFDEAGGTAVAVYTIQNDSGTPAFLSIAPGGDADAFTLISGFAFISGPVVLSFFEAPDFENPADADGDNVYVVTLLADDGQGHTETITVSVAVEDVDESPTSNSPSAIDVAENTDFVGVFTATAYSGDPADVTLGSGDDSALFAFDTNTNTLTFLTRPDFEAPTDGDQDNTYIVNLNADDGVGNQGSFAVTVNVTDVSAPVVIFTPSNPVVDENSTLVSGTFTAEDESGNPVDITIGNTVDAAAIGAPDGIFFDIDNSTGQLSFIAPPDFENPQDAATNNGPNPGAADNEYVLLLRAENAAGDVASQIVTVQVQNVNEAPFFVGNPTSLAFSTNEGQQDAFTAAATDPDGTTPTYSLSGDDAHLFESANPAGTAFRFIAPPNFESFADDDGDNIFDVVLEVSDGEFVATLPVAITLQNVAPDFGAAPALVELAENNLAVGIFAATDPASADHTYSLSGGADDALFNIDGNTGLLNFVSAPDFENADDVGADNDYQIRIVADDGAGGVTAHALTVRVLDVNEAPFATVTSFTTAEEQREALDIAAQDDEGENIVVTIVGGVADGALFEVIGGQLFFRSAPSFENPQGGGSSNQYDVTLNLFDGTNNTQVPVTIDVTNVEEAPLFDNAAAISVVEGTAGDLGVSATDPDTENKATLTIIGGDDRFQGEGGPTFAIVGNALQFVTPPDFETPTDLGSDNTYEVILRAEDAAGQITDQTLVLTVTNVVEDPFARQTSFTADEEQPGAFDVMPVGDAGGEVAVSLVGGPDADDEGAPRFVVNDNVISFINAPDFENPVDGGATPDNVYEIIVRLTQDGRNVDVPISITVLPVNEAPELVGSPAFAVPEGFAGNLATFIDPDNGQEAELFGLQRDPAAGQDIDFFAINFVDNHLLFDAPLDFENPQSADGDNVYEVTVLVDGTNGGPSTQQTLLIEITNVNEAPVFVSPAAFGVDEGITGGLGVFARDPDDNAPGMLTIVGGSDRFDGEGAPLFEIVNNDLRFINAPDFENPLDVGGDNTYNVVLRATDGEGLFEENTFNITVRDAADPVVAGVTSFTVDENQSGSFDIEPTSDNAGPVTVTFLNGIDLVDGDGAPLFEITNNIISFVVPPDFEAPLDDTNVVGGGDGTPDNIYTFSILMDDGAVQNAAAITIEVLPVDEAPIPAGGSAFSVPENTVTNLTTFTDPDTGNAATIVGIDAAGGEDGDQFAVVGNVFRFASRPDFENPGDTDQDREYLVTVIVEDPTEGSNVNVDLAITITEVDEPPELLSPFTYSLNENVTGGLGVQTEDPETRTPGTLTIIGGADQALFQIVDNDLEFIAAPDFENPLDSADASGQVAGDNVYSVRLQSFDGGNQIVQFSQVITILNVEEAPIPVGGSAFAVPENTAGSLVTFADPDSGNTAAIVDVDPSGLEDSNRFFVIGGELRFQTPPDFESPTDANEDQEYLVTVIVNDPSLGDDVNVDLAITVTPVDEPPIALSDPTILIDENFLGFLGLDIEDPEGDNITITNIGGADGALFSNGFTDIRFTNAPNFEIPGDADTDNDYEVLLTVEDAGGNEVQFARTIRIGNLEEQPQVVGGPNITLSENHTGRVATIIDPDTGNDAQILSVGTGIGTQPDGSFFDVVANEIVFITPPDFENPVDDTDLANNGDGVPDNTYGITVFVRDTTSNVTHARDIFITVENENEPPVLQGPAAFTVQEGFTGNLATFIDPDTGLEAPYRGRLRHDTLSPDVDAFTIDNDLNELRFVSIPDFENPLDVANGAGDGAADNVYVVTVIVEDDFGGFAYEHQLTITVENVEEAPVSDKGLAFSVLENFDGELTTFTDPDTGNDADIIDVFFPGEGAAPDGGLFTIDAESLQFVFKSPPDFENPLDDDGDNVYHVTVTVSDPSSGFISDVDLAITVLDIPIEPFFVSDIDGDNGFALDGGAYDEPFGSQMAFGDFDGDGFADIQITNPHDLRDVGVKTFGKVYVVYGGEDPFAGAAEVDVDGLPLSQAFVTIADDQDGLGRDVLHGVGLRDVNNDGAADSLTFVRGAAFTTDGEGQSGIEFGGQRRAADVNANDEVLGSQGLFRGGEGEEEVILVSTGDLNADGYEDFVFRGGTVSTDPNKVVIVFGNADRFSENALEDVAEQANTLTLTGFKASGAVGLNNGFAVNTNIATGDINGDRIADLLISDPFGTGAGAREGEVFVVFGSDEGFPSEIDVNALDGTNGFRIHGDGTRLGDTIAYLGDINGDNIGDFAVSSIYGGPGGHGEVFVFHGSTDGFGGLIELDPNSGDPFVFDGTNGTRFQYGRTADNPDEAQFGNGLSAGGDFDGDGLDDFVIGAHYADNDAGAVFVVYGKEGGHGPVADLYNLDPATFFRIHAASQDGYGGPGDRIGYNVTGGGDVNGDGLDDIGTWSYYYGISEGKAYVIFGEDKHELITHMGTSAGEDIFGDSNANIIIGAQGDDRLFGSGGADVLKGGQGDDLLLGQEGQKRLEGDSGFDTVEFVGLNGDVLNLLPTAAGGGAIEFFGVLKEVEVLDFDANGGTDIRIDRFAVQEITDSRNELRIIGDTDDIVTLGDPGWLLADTVTLDSILFKRLEHAGTTLLVQNEIVLAGEAVTLPPFTLGDLNGANGFSIEAGYPDNFAAQMSFGDFDGDGFADMQFTNPDYDRIPGATNAGKTYVVYGGEDPFSGAAQVDIDDLGLDQAFSTVADDQGVNAQELSGTGLRDVNNDGFADALTFVRDGRGASGIEFGGQRQPHHANIHAEALGFQGLFEGLEGSRETTLATTGDLNADGYEDFIFRTGDGVGEGDNEVIIVFGDPTFFSQDVIEKVSSGGAGSITLTGFDTYGSVGLRTGAIDLHTMATGDINGDRIDDLIIADHKTGTDRAGHVYVVFGDGSGFAGNIDVTTLDGTDGFRIEGERYTGLGQAIDFVGDVNGDNIGDFVVAAPYGFGNGYAYLVLGSDDPFDAVIDLETNPNYFDGTNGTRFETSGIDEYYFGRSVAGAGDVDGDGLNDLVIGAPNAGGDYDPGAVYIVYGNEAGLGASFDVSTPNNASHFTVQGLSYDRAGYTVAGGADINGDGFDDVGTYGYYYGYSGGGAFIIFGADRRGNVQNSGTSGNDSIFGDGSNATIIGGVGNDSIWGNGADVLLGGQGDDWFIATTGIDKIDGGTGTDTAKFVGIGATINLLPDFLGGDVLEFYGILQDIEIVDIDRNIDTNLRLDALAVQQVTDSGNELRVTGDVGDSVTLVDAGWEQVRLVTIDNVDYQELRHGGQSLLVDADLTLAGIAPTNQAPFYAVGEPPTPVPSPFNFSVDEGLAMLIPDLGYDPEGGDIRYQVMGDDRNLFAKTASFATPPDTINTRGQTLKLNIPFDFEVPTDVGADGTYNVTVRVEDDFGLFTDHEFIITVNNVAEAPIDVDLATINGTNGFVIDGANTGSLDSTGISFAGGQDFNDDGIADVVIVNHRYDAGAGRDYGEAIVVYGYNTASANLADGIITRNEVFGSGGADGFVTRAPDTDDQMLHAQLVGDMDGDGRSELALGLIGGDRAVSGNKFTTEGELYLLTGGNGFNQTNSPPFGAGIRLVGAEEGDALGWSIGGPGDFNGDGYNDLVVTADAQHATPQDQRSGEIYVIYGHENGVRGEFIDGRYSLDLSDLDGGNGFSITTYFQSELGENVAFGGDINGDGRDDLIASGLRRFADLNEDGIDELDVEGALIYWGSDQPQPVVNDALNLQSGQSSLVLMDAQTDFVTAGGDINGDGYGDFVVSMNRFVGQAFVVFGAADMPDIIDPGQVLNETGEVEGFVINGIDSTADFGAMSFGDMNGDGFDDLIIAETSIGAANDRFYVIYGSDEQFDTQFNLVSMKRSSSSTSKDGLIIQSDSNSGARGIDQIGFADVNNDGFDDALLGAPNDNKGYVLFGDATGAVADVVRGTTGADTLTVANGRHAVFGMDDRDVIEVTLGSFSNTFRLVDGGTGEDSFGFRASDTLEVQNGGNIDLDDGNHQIKNIEIIDLTNTEANEVYLTPQLVAGMSPEFDFITIVGDEAGGLDSVVSYDQWVSLGSVIFGGPDGENLSGYRSGDTYLFIETGIDVSTFDLVDFGLELGLNGSGFVQFDAAPVDDGPLTIMLYAAVDDGAAANDAMALFSIGAVGGGDLLTFGLDTFGANALDVDFEGQSAGVQARVGDAPQTDENVWHHYAVVLDDTNEDGFYSSDEVAIYFDGQRILDTFVSGTEVIDFSQGTSFVLGAEILTNDGSAFADGENLFDGSIDDVAIFDRALTAAEIAAYAGSVKPLDYHEDDLVDYYSFDDGTLNDQSFSSAGSGNGSAVGTGHGFFNSSVADLPATE